MVLSGWYATTISGHRGKERNAGLTRQVDVANPGFWHGFIFEKTEYREMRLRREVLGRHF